MSKAPTRAYLLVPVFTQTIREHNLVGRTFYEVNYIYSRTLVVWPTHTSLGYISFSFPGKEIAPQLSFMRRDLENLPTGLFVSLCTATCDQNTGSGEEL